MRGHVTADRHPGGDQSEGRKAQPEGQTAGDEGMFPTRIGARHRPVRDAPVHHAHNVAPQALPSRDGLDRATTAIIRTSLPPECPPAATVAMDGTDIEAHPRPPKRRVDADGRDLR